MAAAFAASLGAVAMAIALAGGALAGDAVTDVVGSSLVVWVAFSAVGYLAGSAMDVLVRQDLEEQFRRRVNHFREEVESLGGNAKDEGRSVGQDA